MRQSVLVLLLFCYAVIAIIDFALLSSVLTNWENEFKRWGHFSVESYSGPNKAQALNKIFIGEYDILLCGKSMLTQKSYSPLLDIQWKLVVVDEFHEYKNKKTNAYKCLEEIRNNSVCPLVGMTGTLMSNAHKELYTLIDLVQPGLLGDWKEFKGEYSRPIMLARYVLHARILTYLEAVESDIISSHFQDEGCKARCSRLRISSL